MTPEEITMTNFETLRRAALTSATELMAGMSGEQQAFIERACAAGGRLTLELGPLPDCRRVALSLIEHEGRRVELCFAALVEPAL